MQKEETLQREMLYSKIPQNVVQQDDGEAVTMTYKKKTQ